MQNFRETAAWQFAKRLALDPVRRAAVKAAYGRRVPLHWVRGNNWGDALSPILVELLSGKKAMHVVGNHHDRYMAIGSLLDDANERTEVWGSGFIREKGAVVGRPRAIHAVRGPLSRSLLLKQGIDCPELYGDPALLLPRFFNPDVSKRYSVGIVPHYIDKANPWLERYRNDPQVLILDIESGVQNFVRAVKSCEVILSSSLHGLICADSYGVPNVWIQFSDDVIGGDFKFRDYRLSIGAEEPKPLRLTEETSLMFAASKAVQRPLNIDLRKLMLACPFLSESLRDEIRASALEPAALPKRFVSPGLGGATERITIFASPSPRESGSLKC